MKTLFTVSSEIEARGLVNLVRSHQPLVWRLCKTRHDYHQAAYVCFDRETKTISLYKDLSSAPDSELIERDINDMTAADILDYLKGDETYGFGDVTLKVNRDEFIVKINGVPVSFPTLNDIHQAVFGEKKKSEVVMFEYLNPEKSVLSSTRILIVKKEDKKTVSGLDVLDDFKFKTFRKENIIGGEMKPLR